jgi:predicted permease
MSILINVILPIFLAVGVVALAQPWLKLDTGTLSRISFHIFLPALVFESLLGPTLAALNWDGLPWRRS